MRQKGFAPILILLVAIGLGLLAYFSFFYKTPSPPLVQETISPLPTLNSSVTAEPTTKPTTDPTANWKIHKGKEFQFSYPPDWIVDESFNDYFGGQIIDINNSTGIVSIKITPSGQPYGFSGQTELVKTKLSFSFEGKEYTATQNIIENRAAFVDQEVNVNGNNYFILFGTGYPVNDDQKASLTEFQKEKSTIILILSTFKSIK